MGGLPVAEEQGEQGRSHNQAVAVQEEVRHKEVEPHLGKIKKNIVMEKKRQRMRRERRERGRGEVKER